MRGLLFMCALGLVMVVIFALRQPVVSSYHQSPENARQILMAQGIPFNTFEFIRHAADAPPGILALFINGLVHPNAITQDGYTALMVAARAGNAPNVTFLLKAGASVRPRTTSGVTALMMAAEDCTHPELIRMLLNAGSQINEEADDGSTALTLASPSRRCNPDVIKELVKAGADPNHINHHGWTPLMKAITNNCLANVNVLLELGANPNQKAGKYEWPPIVAAVVNAVRQHGSGEQMVESLIKHGADPNASGKNTSNALKHARGHATLSKLLLDAGAAPLPPAANEARVYNDPLKENDLLPPIDCKAFNKALNLKLPCYGEYH